MSNGRVGSPDSGDPTDASDDISLGASWSWNSAYADASVWRSTYDSRGIQVDDYDWAGHGADLSFGFYGSNLSVDTSFGLNRSENLAPASRSVDKSLDGALWLALRPEALPDLSAGVSFGRYGNDYFAYDETRRLAYDEVFRTDTWELGFDLDFSKSLVDWKAVGQPTLKMTYRCGNATPTLDGELETDHTLAVLFQLKL